MRFEFRIDSPIWRLFDFLGEILVTNVLFILTSIPIVTMGASVTAMNTVFFRRSERKLDSVAKTYFASFKENFVQSTIIWMLYLSFVVVCILNIYVNTAYLLVDRRILMMVFGVLLAILTITVMFALAMTARFKNSLTQTLVKAVIIGVLNAPFAITIVLMLAACWIVTFSNAVTLLVCASLWLTLGFGLAGYLSCLMFLRAFRRFTAKEDLEEDSQTEEMYRAREADQAYRRHKKNSVRKQEG